VIDEVNKHGRVAAEYTDSFDKMVDVVSDRVQDGDLVLTLGAGDIFKVGERILARLENNK
jgi:UDP-N-acetylmuramate--alanine ligase